MIKSILVAVTLSAVMSCKNNCECHMTVIQYYPKTGEKYEIPTVSGPCDKAIEQHTVTTATMQAYVSRHVEICK